MKLIVSVLGILLINYCSVGIASLTEVRKFTTTINPDCITAGYTKNCSTYNNLTLLHIQSDGKKDSYHFIWSFVGAPTLIMARTSLNSVLSINWAQMMDATQISSISFDPKPNYSFGWSLEKIWIADDSEDVVTLDKMNQSLIQSYKTQNFIWQRLDNESYANSTDIHFSLISRHYKHEKNITDLGKEGYFKFTIRMKSSEGYSDVLPYMLYSENSTQVDIAFNDVQLNRTEADYPKHPRIGFKYLIIQDEIYQNNSERMRLERTKSIDDEHTPGVFETFSVRTPVLNHSDQSFMQWKPICYTGQIRDVIDSVDVNAYPLANASSVKGDDDNYKDSILYSFYGDNMEHYLLEAMNISFGTQQDGFYNKTKHISWTYSTGFGSPPEDFVSLLVLLVVGIGLGIPALIIILSVVYVVVKRFKQPRDDLLLGGR